MQVSKAHIWARPKAVSCLAAVADDKEEENGENRRGHKCSGNDRPKAAAVRGQSVALAGCLPTRPGFGGRCAATAERACGRCWFRSFGATTCGRIQKWWARKLRGLARRLLKLGCQAVVLLNISSPHA